MTWRAKHGLSSTFSLSLEFTHGLFVDVLKESVKLFVRFDRGVVAIVDCVETFFRSCSEPLQPDLIIVLTLYFLSSLEATKHAIYRLAPASRRERVSKLGDQVVASVGGYVAGAFIIAVCAGLFSLVFLFIVGLGEYAVALAFVVMLLDVIPMIGATIGAVILLLIVKVIRQLSA